MEAVHTSTRGFQSAGVVGESAVWKYRDNGTTAAKSNGGTGLRGRGGGGGGGFGAALEVSLFPVGRRRLELGEACVQDGGTHALVARGEGGTGGARALGTGR